MNFAKYFSVITVSMLKFIGGPLTGLALNLTWIETFLCSVLGMMISVVMVVYLGDYIQSKRKKTNKFSKLTRFSIKTRQKFGLKGIAFFTPILFSPIGGTALAIAFRYNKNEILIQMLISSILWGLIETLAFYYAKGISF